MYISTDLDVPESKDNSEDSAFYTEPTSTQQVFVVQSVMFDDNQKPIKKIRGVSDGNKDKNENGTTKKVSLKTSTGTYLGVNSDGSLSAKSTAISAQQMFIIVPIDDESEDTHDDDRKRFRLYNSAWDKFVSISSDKIGSTTKYVVKAAKDLDSETLDPGSIFVIRMQAKYQKGFHERLAKSLNGSNFNEDYISSRTLKEKAGKDLSREEIKKLKKAYAGMIIKKRFIFIQFIIHYSLTNFSLFFSPYYHFVDGRLNEALLDLREKSKTDTRCF